MRERVPRAFSELVIEHVLLQNGSFCSQLLFDLERQELKRGWLCVRIYDYGIPSTFSGYIAQKTSSFGLPSPLRQAPFPFNQPQLSAATCALGLDCKNTFGNLGSTKALWSILRAKGSLGVLQRRESSDSHSESGQWKPGE